MTAINEGVPLNVQYYITLFLMAAILLSVTTIFAVLMSKFVRTKSKDKRFKAKTRKGKEIAAFSKFTSLLSIFLAVVSIIFDFIHIERGYSIPKLLHNGTFPYIRSAADMSMFASLLTYYVYLYGHLNIAFRETPFALTTRFKMISAFLFCIVILLDLLYISLVLFDTNQDTVPRIHAIVYGTFTWFHSAYFLSVIVTFIYKLRQITICTFNNQLDCSCEASPKSLTPSPSLKTLPSSDSTYTLIDVITKLTALSFVSFALFFCRFTYRQIIGMYDEDIMPEIVWMISYLWRDVMLLSVALSMYLGFKFNEKQYRKCCFILDECCRDLCINSMDREKDRMQELDL